jgi:hypothetical protein
LGFWVSDLTHELDFISKPTDSNGIVIWFGFGGRFHWGKNFSTAASFLDSRLKMMPSVGPRWAGLALELGLPRRVGHRAAIVGRVHRIGPSGGGPHGQNEGRKNRAGYVGWAPGEGSSGAGQRKRKEEKGWAGRRELESNLKFERY